MTMAFQRKVNRCVVSSIDPGEIHTIASVTRRHSLVITGRYMRSLHRLRNMKLGEIQRLMFATKRF